MKVKEERTLIVRVIEFAIERERFTFQELIDSLNLSVDERVHIGNTFVQSDSNDNNTNYILAPFKPIDPKDILDILDAEYCILPSAYFSYIDYLEIKEARKSSKWAFWLSIAAIILSTVVGGVQIYFQLYPIGN